MTIKMKTFLNFLSYMILQTALLCYTLATVVAKEAIRKVLQFLYDYSVV